MIEGERNELLELGGFMKQGYSAIVTNAGKAIAAVTLVMATLITFTDVAFCQIGGERFTLSLAVMLISSYLMYFSLEDAGEREGERTEEYLTALDRYTAAKKRISPEMVDSLRDFCLDYSRREQEYRRLCYLVENGLSATDYEDYLAGVRFGRKSRRILRRARSLRAVKLTPSILLNGRGGVGKSELLGPGRDKLVSGLISLIPTTVCTVFTVSIILTAKDGLTATTVIEGIIRLCALPVVGFRGTVDGYNFARDSKSAWLETKARLLESFLGAKV